MALNIFQTPDQPMMLMQKQWSSQLNPFLANILIQGRPITSIDLVANTPLTLNHYLGRQMIGWILIDNTAFCEVKRTQLLNSQTLTLEANADTTISLWCF